VITALRLQCIGNDLLAIRGSFAVCIGKHHISYMMYDDDDLVLYSISVCEIKLLEM
jgi:hypothetical protein